MKANQILTASYEDIVFDGRNKAYGAYELRQHYEQRIVKALLGMGMILTAGIFLALNAGSESDKPRFRITEGSSTVVIKQPDKPLKEPEKIKEPEKPKVKMEKLVNTIKIVDKPIVTPPPTVEDLKTADIGDKKLGGDDFKNIQQPKPEDPDKETGVIDKRPEPDAIADIVEVEAKYPGDWKKFLERNLNPEVPVSNDAPAGRYSVVIQFIVDKEGNVSGINALTNHGYGMEQEAIRVIKKAPKWEPAFQNGIHVKAYRRQVIVFEVNGE